MEAFLYRGIAHYEAGHKEKALRDLEKVIHYYKQSADAKYYKAMILHEKGLNEAALIAIADAQVDFDNGFYNNRPYVETLRQIYPEDLEGLKKQILNTI